MLLYLAQFEDGSEDGVYRTLDRLETQYLGSSALLKFMHERRDDGLLLFTEHSKRSKWRIALNGALREALFAILERRHAGGKESVSLLETIRAQPGKRCD